MAVFVVVDVTTSAKLGDDVVELLPIGTGSMPAVHPELSVSSLVEEVVVTGIVGVSMSI